jgi:hypothetical protein
MEYSGIMLLRAVFLQFPAVGTFSDSNLNKYNHLCKLCSSTTFQLTRPTSPSTRPQRPKSFITQTPNMIDCSPLAWWLREEQQQRYPRLSKMAIDILSIPAMSAEPERVFSGARRTIAWDRCQLGGRTVERGECMKNWIKSGITQGIPVDLVEKNQESKGSKTTVWRASTSDSLDEAG